MESVRVELGERSYDIIIGEGNLDSLGERSRPFGFSRAAIISNPTVFDIYGERALFSLGKSGLSCDTVLIPDGESYKDFSWCYHILSELLKNRHDRKSCLFALGGGVIGDITGFAASLYMRGISFVQIPTTLLAQVDSSVGGKTGVNHPAGKNMIGSFYQPKLVLIDTSTLKTLPQREVLCGMAEVLKYGVIKDAELFDFMERRCADLLSLKEDAVAYIVKRSCEIKADVVSEDEKESGLREILNYGHTVGHAIETETSYSKYLHGEAVAIGMCSAARLAVELGLMKHEDAERIKSVVEAYGLPSSVPSGTDINALIGHMKLDKKAVSGNIKFVLPEKIGRVKIVKGVSESTIKKALQG
ncbi:MAG: 3-dehydroquinate synthase [Nitrospirae bacterium]|nr:MAG: 3-dehydroquinate synthase [Nitrospirota bacterium]